MNYKSVPVVTTSPRPVSETHATKSSGCMCGATVNNCGEMTKTCLCNTPICAGALGVTAGVTAGILCYYNTPVAACIQSDKVWMLPTFCGLGCGSVGSAIGMCIRGAASGTTD